MRTSLRANTNVYNEMVEKTTTIYIYMQTGGVKRHCTCITVLNNHNFNLESTQDWFDTLNIPFKLKPITPL